MQIPRSPYQVLNVSPDAEPEVIEAAYKVLMEKYHPDKLIGGPPVAEEKAAELNNAYAILRSPERRARHDADEKARRPVITKPDWTYDPNRGNAPFAPRPAQAQDRPPPQPPRPPMRVPVAAHAKPGRKIAGWSGLIAALVLVGFAIAVARDPTGASRFRSAAAVAAEEGAKPAETPVSKRQVNEAVVEFDRVRTLYGPVGVAAYSDACFQAQNRTREINHLDFCVAFDHAANALDAGSSQPFQLGPSARFDDQQLASRHIGAAKLLPQDYEGMDDRLADIRTLTHTAIADKIQRDAAAEAATAAAGSPKSQPQRAVRRPAQRNPRPAGRTQPGQQDAEFLEREGGIY